MRNHKAPHIANAVWNPKTTTQSGDISSPWSKAYNYSTCKTMHATYFYQKGKKETTYTMLHEYPKMWNISLSNNIGRLSQGIVDVVGNNTTAFIPHHLVQKGKSGIHKHGM